MKNCNRIARMAAAAAACSPAFVQPAVSAETASPVEVMSGAPPTDPTKPVSVPSAVSVTSTQDSTTATLKGTFNAPTVITPTSQETSSVTATLTSPITKGGLSTNLAALNGFANATYLTLQYSQFLTHVDQAASSQRQTIIARCVQDELTAYSQAQTALAAAHQDTTVVDGIVANLRGGGSVCEGTIATGSLMDTTPFEAKVGLDMRQLALPERMRLREALAAWRSDFLEQALELKAQKAGYALSYGLTGKVGYESHDYYQTPSLAKATTTGAPWSTGGYFTYVATEWTWAVTAQYDYQDAFKDQTTKTECPASSATSPTTCVSGAIGHPSKSIKNLLTLEWRYKAPIPKWFGGDSLGFAPSATYDATSHVYGATALIFVFGNGTGGLTGGIDASWQSDTHHVSAGIFVTQPFSITGQSASSAGK